MFELADEAEVFVALNEGAESFVVEGLGIGCGVFAHRAEVFGVVYNAREW